MTPTDTRWTNWQTRQMYTKVRGILDRDGAGNGPWEADTLRGLVLLPLEGTNWQEVADEINGGRS